MTYFPFGRHVSTDTYRNHLSLWYRSSKIGLEINCSKNWFDSRETDFEVDSLGTLQSQEMGSNWLALLIYSEWLKMVNKVKMSEFDLWELGWWYVSYRFLTSHQKTLSHIGFLTKKDFYQIFIFLDGRKRELFKTNLIRWKTVKIWIGCPQLKLNSAKAIG